MRGTDSGPKLARSGRGTPGARQGCQSVRAKAEGPSMNPLRQIEQELLARGRKSPELQARLTYTATAVGSSEEAEAALGVNAKKP